MFPDPSLTPENLSIILDIMVDWPWNVFSHYVNIPKSEINEIYKQSSSLRERKLAVSPHLISTHPSLSWRLVAHALYRMVPLSVYGGDAVSCHRALDHLQQKFPTGNTYCIPFSRVSEISSRVMHCACVDAGPHPPIALSARERQELAELASMARRPWIANAWLAP